MNQIRPIALCIFRNSDRILVFEGHDPVKGETFYRPLGGGIEFGERSEEAVRRELKEELDVEITNLKFIGTLENIFTFNGNSYHEVVLIYDGTLTASELYQQALLTGKEANGDDIRAIWKNLQEFEAGESILYPVGLLELLRTETS
ncbi:MAG TPA: NUDIX domain-containing protein [Anaerolineales bacterium]|nr:NUDIX domain-containing protein [Anaerolineales bacterium]